MNMYVKQLKFANIRNLSSINIDCSPHFNWIFGKNGSGKSSILEGIYLLGTGRSFRTTHPEDYVQKGQESCCSFGLLVSKQGFNTKLGLERHREGQLRLNLNEESCNSLADWVKNCVVQLINTDSYQLLNGSPIARRSFMDWTMFHVEPSFFPQLQRYRRALKQRNAVLKNQIRNQINNQNDLIKHWTHELIEMGTLLNQARKAFFQRFIEILKEKATELLKIDPEMLNFEFLSGWDEHSFSLYQALNRALMRDKALGYTSAGPHRADFKFTYENIPVETLFSRGQLKLFITALFLSRARFVFEAMEHSPICLLDDLHSELDLEASMRLIEGLQKQNAQIFLTSIENPIDTPLYKILTEKLNTEFEMFHVEHGKISKKRNGKQSMELEVEKSKV